jgi:KDO2-lipid IV(A) lauroyltransferase
MLSRLGLWFMRMTARWPLAWVRGLGALLGDLLFWLVPSRRHVADTNLRLCFPDLSEGERRALVRRNFRIVAQTWLDRGWLWHAPPEVTARRLKLTGAVEQFRGNDAIVIFAPHFLGLDAGATALSQQVPWRQFDTIYATQSNPVVDAWVAEGRNRFGNARLRSKNESVKSIIAELREGHPLYLLPDMDFGAADAVFVPFFGVQAATITSLPRFARLGRAKVIPMYTRLTPTGYETVVEPAWADYPTKDVTADTALMNQRLEAEIRTMPEQYYWVHRRFKTRPEGEASVY